jgi:hypothetical protein
MEGNQMECPEMLQGESLTRIIQGTILGVIATAFVGFNYAGWSLESTADKMALEKVQLAVIAALTPICVEKFQSSSEVKENLVKLKAIQTWKQDTFIEQAGWATFAGNDKANAGVARACALVLNGETK